MQRAVFPRGVAIVVVLATIGGCAWAPAKPPTWRESAQAPSPAPTSRSGPPWSVETCKHPPNCPA